MIDGFLHAIGEAVTEWGVCALPASGFVRGYAAIILLGALILIGCLLICGPVFNRLARNS